MPIGSNISTTWQIITTAIIFAVTPNAYGLGAQANGGGPQMPTIVTLLPSAPDPDDERFLNDIDSAGIVAPSDQAIKVAREVVDHAYSMVMDFGVHDYHVPAFVQAAMNAYIHSRSSWSDADERFLSELRSAGFTKEQISDKQAVDAAHKVVYWVCDREGPSRLDVEDLLFRYGIEERRGPRSASAFAGAALRTYRHSDDPTAC